MPVAWHGRPIRQLIVTDGLPYRLCRRTRSSRPPGVRQPADPSCSSPTAAQRTWCCRRRLCQTVETPPPTLHSVMSFQHKHDVFVRPTTSPAGKAVRVHPVHYFVPRQACEVLWSACLCACLSVCPLAYLKTTRPNFLYMLPVAVAQSSSDGNAIRYVLPVLWTMRYV